eukprot:TRINITY_DN7308_c0_g1_i1.p1 TRINITY_DN7308_c0_g1~~TRINITY_DN7308_c0_g1_i1.p1  ORF type:complete len:1115 (+),score=210.69 TRINITY_DN7308_c0_g1_i1:163-3507(+)
MKLSILILSFSGVLGAKLKYEAETDSQNSNATQCLPGFTSSASGCVDIDECGTNSHTCGSSNPCINTPGSFLCKCATGYVGTLPSCQNINECLKPETHTCQNAGPGVACKDTTGSFECECSAGWANMTYVGITPSCRDINECAAGGLAATRCHANATCSNTNGSFTCLCGAGWTGNGTVCSDVDECTTNKCASVSAGSICTNTIGSYNCDCAAGWNKTRNDSDVCSNINECTGNMSNHCNGNATCIDIEGSFMCKCRPGYVGDGVNRCVDEDECTRPKPCPMSPLAASRCNNTVGSFTCLCKTGFAQVAPNQKCENINECNATNPRHTCNSTSGVCQDTIGSFQCSCNAGYSVNATSKICEDTDECKSGDMGCNRFGPGFGCINTPGSFQCGCGPGYMMSGGKCLNINECLANNHTCDNTSGKCIDTDGSFKCACKDGYVGDGKSCLEMDECVFGKHNCAAKADCTNTNGSFTCACQFGFEGNGTACKDINECDNKTSGGSNGSQGVTWGSHGCASGTSTCLNTDGSFDCTCNAGYSGDGKECININECTNTIDICGRMGECHDTPGSFYCACKPGYRFEHETCVDIDECKFVKLANLSTTFDQKFPNGTVLGNSSPACHPNATCINTVGSFKCSCGGGFHGDFSGKQCENVDECVIGSHNCDDNARCKDTYGSFTCTCMAGFKGTGTRYSGGWPAKDGCWDIDECKTPTNLTVCANHSVCTNTVGSYVCECGPGWEGDPKKECVNVNECLKNSHHCHPEAICADTDGSYTCKCKAGYVDPYQTTWGQVLEKSDRKPLGTLCKSQKRFEIGTKRLTNTSWQTIYFDSAFKVNPIVVGTLHVTGPGKTEVVPRIRNVTTKSFEIAIAFAAHKTAAEDAAFQTFLMANLPMFNFIAVVSGKHKELPTGLNIWAGRAVPTGQTQKSTMCKTSNLTFWNKILFANYTSQPVILAQIQGPPANASWNGGAMKDDFCTTGVKYNRNGHLGNQAFVSRICTGRPASVFLPKEPIGWVVIGQHQGQFVMTPNAYYYASVVSKRPIVGLGATEELEYGHTFKAAPIVIANKVAAGDRVIGWANYQGAGMAKAFFEVEPDPECPLKLLQADYYNAFATSKVFSL